MKRNRASSKSTLLVLAQLMQGPQYGYGLMQSTGLKSGTLYPILMRLTDRVFLLSEWIEPQMPGRPPRQSYRLTAQGRRYASESLDAGNETGPSGVPA